LYIYNVHFVGPNRLSEVELYKSPSLGPLGKKCKPSSLPSDIQISGAAYTRIKGTGVGLKGIELQLLVTTPDELIVFRPDGSPIFRRPLAGMHISKQALDGVRIVSSDQQKIDIVVGLAFRARVMEHLLSAVSGVAGSSYIPGGLATGSTATTFATHNSNDDQRRLSAEDLKDFAEEAVDNFQDDDEETDDDNDADY
jgi:hypothetical protein